MRASLTIRVPMREPTPVLQSGFVRDDITFDSHGTPCAAWHYRRRDDRPGPLVVIAHGFDGVREQRLDAYAERFSRAGLASLVFDYRYFGSSGGATRQLYSNRAQLDDWRAAIAYARQLPGVDADRIALWGTSSSGGHVVALAAEDDRIAAVVTQMPFADGLAQFLLLPAMASFRLLRAGLRDGLSSAVLGEPRLIAFGGRPGALAISTSNDALTGLARITPPGSTWRDEITPRFALTAAFYRPGRAAERVRCPLLVCVADGDLLIAPKPAVRIARRADRGELRRFPFGHFAMYTGPGFDRVAAIQADFLRRALLAEPPDAAAAARRTPELRAIA